MITSSLDIAIAIGVATYMIKRVVSCTSWEILISHGCQRSNQLSHFPSAKLSTSYYSKFLSCIWLKNLLKELGLPQKEPIEICVGNKSTIALSKNPIFHD